MVHIPINKEISVRLLKPEKQLWESERFCQLQEVLGVLQLQVYHEPTECFTNNSKFTHTVLNNTLIKLYD